MRTLKKRYRELKRICDELNVILKPFKFSNSEDICILSDNEFDLLEKRSVVKTKNSHFISEDDYERYFLESNEDYN